MNNVFIIHHFRNNKLVDQTRLSSDRPWSGLVLFLTPHRDRQSKWTSRIRKKQQHCENRSCVKLITDTKNL
jgi:hypothetical protein